MAKRQDSFDLEAVLGLGFFVAMPASIAGWVMNLQNLFQYEMNQTEFVVSAIGVFAFPVGIFTGYLY